MKSDSDNNVSSSTCCAEEVGFSFLVSDNIVVKHGHIERVMAHLCQAISNSTNAYNTDGLTQQLFFRLTDNEIPNLQNEKHDQPRSDAFGEDDHHR